MVGKPILIGISGTTNSGKTYFSDILVEHLAKQNISSTVIKTDLFYKDLKDIPMSQRERVNYDMPDSIDDLLFKQSVQKLARGEDLDIYDYDFSTHSASDTLLHFESAQIIIVEGIFAFSFEEIMDSYDLKIFVYYPSVNRYFRRILRDIKERGRSLESVINQIENTVSPTEEETVKKDRDKADFILYGGQDYENVLSWLIDAIRYKLKL